MTNPVAAPSSSSAMILVVEDDASNLDMIATAIVSAGYQTVLAANAQEALALFDSLSPDLILLDAIMPGIDGFALCRMIKTRPALADIPVIFMTGLTDTRHVLEGLSAGGVDYVTKPVVIDELLARISVHLANARAARGARQALDMVGRRLIATGRDGVIRWSTPQATALLMNWSAKPGSQEALDDAITRAIERDRQTPAGPGAPATARIGNDEYGLDISLIGRTAARDYLFRLTELAPDKEQRCLAETLGLTPREAEVLFWIARGKSNRDISDILNISARTVNKHLEQVFVKLGVEKRSAAAAIATRVTVANF